MFGRRKEDRKRLETDLKLRYSVAKEWLQTKPREWKKLASKQLKNDPDLKDRFSTETSVRLEYAERWLEEYPDFAAEIAYAELDADPIRRLELARERIKENPGYREQLARVRLEQERPITDQAEKSAIDQEQDPETRAAQGIAAFIRARDDDNRRLADPDLVEQLALELVEAEVETQYEATKPLVKRPGDLQTELIAAHFDRYPELVDRYATAGLAMAHLAADPKLQKQVAKTHLAFGRTPYRDEIYDTRFRKGVYGTADYGGDPGLAASNTTSARVVMPGSTKVKKTPQGAPGGTSLTTASPRTETRTATPPASPTPPRTKRTRNGS